MDTVMYIYTVDIDKVMELGFEHGHGQDKAIDMDISVLPGTLFKDSNVGYLLSVKS
jgi:hypothetical protein